MKSVSSISNGNQDRSVNISWERNYATWRKFFHLKCNDSKCFSQNMKKRKKSQTFKCNDKHEHGI